MELWYQECAAAQNETRKEVLGYAHMRTRVHMVPGWACQPAAGHGKHPRFGEKGVWAGWRAFGVLGHPRGRGGITDGAGDLTHELHREDLRE